MLRYGLACALLMAGSLKPVQGVAADSAPVLSIAIRAAEPAPLDQLHDKLDEELFLLVDVRYVGSDLLYLNTKDFRLIDRLGRAYYSQPYDGPNPLQSDDLIELVPTYPARTGGWLLFVVPAGDSSLSLLFKLPKLKSSSQSYAYSPVFTPRPAAGRLYGVAAELALRSYLLDEAATASYIRMDLAGPNVPSFPAGLSGAERARLEGGLAALERDRRVFDDVPAVAPQAQTLKTKADASFGAIAHALSGLLGVRSAGDWTRWRSTFDSGDRSLANLYQIWPGLEPDVSLPPLVGRT